LTIKAKNETINYGDAAPAPYTIEDIAFLGTDTKDINDFEGTLSVTCSYAKYNNAGSYDIVPSGYTSKNYTITFEKGTLTVNKIQAQIAWRDKNYFTDQHNANNEYLYDHAASAYNGFTQTRMPSEIRPVVIGGMVGLAYRFKARKAKEVPPSS